MKKIIYTMLLVLFMVPTLIQAQEEAGDITSIKSFPAIYRYNEQVTWYFDMSSTTFAETEDIYIWIWSPSEPDAGNWENSSDFAKLKYEGNKIWSFTLTPTLYFNKTSDEIAASAGFWFRLKNKNGSKQSGVSNVTYTPFDDFADSGLLIKSYPEKPVLDQPLSILFNSNMPGGFSGATSVHMHSGLNDWDLQVQYQSWLEDVAAKTKLKDLGNGIYKMDIVPRTYFNAPDDYVMEKMNFLFIKDDWAATTPDQVLFAGAYVPPPDPIFGYFPLQISQKDFLGIYRKNNEPGVTKLIYTITAGSKVLTGEFTGGVSEIKGFVNLVSELNGIKNLSEIHSVVVDNKGNTISDTMIPLKPVD